MFYVATARKSDSVIQTVKGPFTGPDDLNLIVAYVFYIPFVYLLNWCGVGKRSEYSDNLIFLTSKSLHLEIYVVVDDPSADPDNDLDNDTNPNNAKTLRPVMEDVPIYGRIAYIDLYRPPVSIYLSLVLLGCVARPRAEW